VTITPDGTATNVARRRADLSCDLEAGHAGPHRDSSAGESWEGSPGRPSTLLRHEDDDSG